MSSQTLTPLYNIKNKTMKTILNAYGVASRGRYTIIEEKGTSSNVQHLEFQKNQGISNAITSVYKDAMVLILEKEENNE